MEVPATGWAKDAGGVPDAALVARLGSDEGALDELFRRHRRMVLAYGARRCYQPADVADLLAATFLAALKTASRYDPTKGDVGPWLLALAHRQLGSMPGRQSSPRRAGRTDPAPRVLSDDAIARIEEQIDAAQCSVEIEHALLGLSERHREALRLVDYDHLTPTDAAQVTGLRPSAFRFRLARARRAFRSALRDPVPVARPRVALEVH